ncbi:MAG: hypothetical protein HND42_12210, partial [Armatimonadetes bacterium]|nr:ankyrin repeat domain-containing protein [Armatimonadota bacterium]NOG93991.1 hypothetical protein [Armatimonadota bacterium]
MAITIILTLAAVLTSLQMPASVAEQDRRPDCERVFRAIIAGRWSELDELKQQVGSFNHPIAPWDDTDILSRLAGVSGMAGHYPNALTGMRICIEYGADPNALDGQPLRAAAFEDKWTKMVARLLEYGANPNLTTRYATPLVCAVEGDKPKNVEV